MEKIIIKKADPKNKKKRSAVVIKPENYMKIYELSRETNNSIEGIVDLLLTEALKNVEIQEN